MKRYGFTLAEVLITLAVIGIVAALTIPNVVRNYQKTQTVVQLKKVYSALANTTNLAIADHGPMEGWEFGEHHSPQAAEDFVNTYLIPYLKVSKNCGINTTEACEIKRRTLNQSNYVVIGSGYTRFFLNDGTIISGSIYNTDTDKRLIIYIDINGKKGPDTLGKDVFEFNYWVYNTSPKVIGRFLPVGIFSPRETLILNSTSTSCTKSGTGAYCAALIMQDGWKISDDYPWN